MTGKAPNLTPTGDDVVALLFQALGILLSTPLDHWSHVGFWGSKPC